MIDALDPTDLVSRPDDDASDDDRAERARAAIENLHAFADDAHGEKPSHLDLGRAGSHFQNKAKYVDQRNEHLKNILADRIELDRAGKVIGKVLRETKGLIAGSGYTAGFLHDDELGTLTQFHDALDRAFSALHEAQKIIS